QRGGWRACARCPARPTSAGAGRRGRRARPRHGGRGTGARPEATRLTSMRRFRYVVCDVFTDTALAGNQLAVFTDARDLDPLTMQALAREMNFSETVFVLPPQADDADV